MDIHQHLGNPGKEISLATTPIEASIEQPEYCVLTNCPLVHGRDAANEDLRVGPSQLFVVRHLKSNTAILHNAQSRATTSASALGPCAPGTVVESLHPPSTHICDCVWR